VPDDRLWGSEGLDVLRHALVRERSGGPLFAAPRSRAPSSIAGDQAASLDVEGPPPCHTRSCVATRSCPPSLACTSSCLCSPLVASSDRHKIPRPHGAAPLTAASREQTSPPAVAGPSLRVCRVSDYQGLQIV
jgi:hypothetical protein